MAYYYSNQSYAYQLGLYVTTASQDIENNTSTIYWRLDLLKHSSAYSIAGGSAIFYVEINGVPQMNESIYFAMSSGQTNIGMRDGYVTIPHGADGNAAFGVTFSFTPQTGAAYFPGSMSGSGVYTCATIARATTPSLSADTVELGSSVTITATPATNTFSHKLYYQIGDTEKVSIATLAAGTTTYAWTVPDGIADNFTASTSGTISVVCETFSAETLIGTKSVSLTVTIPSSMVPAISSVTIAEATAGLAAKFGTYVQGRSTLSIATSAAGAHGSTIDSIAVDVGGTAYSGAEVTTGILNASGSVVVKVTVTDSRGRTTATTQTISVTAYSAPTITVANAVRCDANGNADEEGTSIKFTYKFNIAAIGNSNDKSFKIQYLNGSMWTDLYTISSYTGNSSYICTGIVFDAETAYDVRFAVSDYFSTTTVQKQVAPSFVLMDFGAGGKAMAVGMRSSDDGSLESALPLRPYGGLHAYDAGIGMTSGAWVKVFSVRILKRYSYGYFAFTVLQAASGRAGCRVELQISGAAIESQAIQRLHVDNSQYIPYVRAYKGGTDTFDIYVRKQGNAAIAIYSLEYSSDENAQVIPEFIDEEASLPSGATVPVWTGLRDVYPVGAIYLSTVSTSPASLFGGTWQVIGQGRMLVGVGTGTDVNGNSMTFANGATGGEYTSGQLNHGETQYGLGVGGGYSDRSIVSDTGHLNPGNSETNAGVNLMSPYLAVYMWKRTA